jgi:hypothetical protein
MMLLLCVAGMDDRVTPSCRSWCGTLLAGPVAVRAATAPGASVRGLLGNRWVSSHGVNRLRSTLASCLVRRCTLHQV